MIARGGYTWILGTLLISAVSLLYYLVTNISDAKLAVIDGGTHFVFMEKPDEVNRAIEDFLSSIMV